MSEAETYLTEAKTVAHELGDEHTVALLDRALADIDTDHGQWRSATRRLDRTLRFNLAHNDRDNEAETLQSMGHLAAIQSEPEQARELFDRVLQIRRELGQPVEVARALARLQWAHQATGEQGKAEECRDGWRAIVDDFGLDDGCLRLPSHLRG
ncbi:MAG TPA: hypothetical protein VEX15_09830 [Nocardioidaceae bacterium]|nr:hypothetical protein [Nocardioidaceae bacterium]